MNRSLRTTLLVLASGAVMACIKDAGLLSSESAVSGANHVPCDVDAILTSHCSKCHSDPPQFSAPMPLRTLADLHAPTPSNPAQEVYRTVGERLHDAVSPMPPKSQPKLSDAEKATLDGWISAGAPPGAAACADAGVDSGVGWPELPCNPDQHVRPATKYAIQDVSDQYVCYGFDTTSAEKRHVIATGPHIDNRRVVHHVILFQAHGSVSSTPYVCNPGVALGWRFVSAWAPGGENIVLPPEAGFAEEAGTTHWAVQVHYNNVQGLEGQEDETGFDLCSTTNLRRYDADVMATGTMGGINIPPRSEHTTECNFSVPFTFGHINVFAAGPHMHRLGRAESATRIRDGVFTELLNVPDFDFNAGAAVHSVDVDLQRGDKIRTTCTWQNDGDTAVQYGEKTSNEMCFAFLMYYPKIRGPFTWTMPSFPLLSRCTSTTR